MWSSSHSPHCPLSSAAFLVIQVATCYPWDWKEKNVCLCVCAFVCVCERESYSYVGLPTLLCSWISRHNSSFTFHTQVFALLCVCLSHLFLIGLRKCLQSVTQYSPFVLRVWALCTLGMNSANHGNWVIQPQTWQMPYIVCVCVFCQCFHCIGTNHNQQL